MLSDMFNSSLIKQKFIIKQPEKLQRTTSIQNRAAIVKPPGKNNWQRRSNTVDQSVREKQKKEPSSHGKKSQKKTTSAALGSTTGQEKDLVPKITPLCLSTRSSNIIKSKIFLSAVNAVPIQLLFFGTVYLFTCV